MESDENPGIEKVSNFSGTKRVGELSNSLFVNKKNKVSENLEFEDDHEKEPVRKLEFDLNVSINDENLDAEVGNPNQFVHGFDLNDPINEVINISSDDDDDEDDTKLVNSRNDKQKGIEGHYNSELDLNLGFHNHCLVERKYTKEEKGKSKVVELDFFSLSLAREVSQVDPIDEAINLSYRKTPEPIILHPQVIEIPKNQEKKSAPIIKIQKPKECLNLTSVYDHLNNHINGTIFNENSKACGELKEVIDKNVKHEGEKLVDWSPLRLDFRLRVAPSLLNLSLDALVKNADAISSFDHVPEWLRKKLTSLLCETHRMNIYILELLLKDSPCEIRVNNCSWMTQKQLTDTLGKSNLQNLKVLQLDYCGQCSFDDIIPNTLARSPNSLPFLGILSLKGAARLSDNTLKSLLTSAPLLQSINLSQCTLLTHTAIEIILQFLKDNLKELYIDECPRIDAPLSAYSLMKFGHLEVLSVAGIETVSDEFVKLITISSGKKLKELNLAGCVMLTNGCLQSIGERCPVLCSLDVSNLSNLTDLGLCYLAVGCKSLKSLNVTRADFSDEIVAAFVETSGKNLKQLSLNHVGKVSFKTAFSLAKFLKNLVSLDVSWCRELTDEAMGFITDNCLSLKLLKIFGCTQLTEGFLFGHANSQVRVVGRDLVPLVERVKMLEPDEILLQHSALKTPENGM